MKRVNFNACKAELVKISLNIESIYYDVLGIDEIEDIRLSILHSLSEIEKHIKGEK